MLIFILTFNLFFHLTSFGETPFGRDSDLFYIGLSNNLIKTQYVIYTRRDLQQRSMRYLFINSLSTLTKLFYRVNDFLSSILIADIIMPEVHIFLEWQYNKSSLMPLSSHYLHIRNIILEVEMDTRSHVYSVETHKRTNLKVERDVLLSTLWKACTLTSSPVIAFWTEVRGARSVLKQCGSAPFWRSGIHLSTKSM